MIQDVLLYILCTWNFVIFTGVNIKNVVAAGGEEVLFVVLSQSNSYHVKRSEAFKDHFQSQLASLKSKPDLYLLHEKWPELNGGWTVFPILQEILEEGIDRKWIVFCEEETRVKVGKLLKNLATYNAEEEIYLGKGLRDKTRVIIHHFTSIDEKYGFSYPDFVAGFAMSYKLIQRVVKRMNEESSRMNFAIDPKHELANYIFEDGAGVVMNDVSFFCTTDDDTNCATSITSKFPDCGDPTSEDDIFIAVKTCEKFHKTRLPVIQDLWAKDIKNIEFYSETEDQSIPTVDIGVENTEKGHCGKLYAILERAYKAESMKKKAWLVITDDDTLMSVIRLRKLLACYNANETVALGEKYGYSVVKGGYDYITGGGGMVLSMPVVRKIVECSSCVCHDISRPDDMMLGVWLKHLGIPVTHSALFHQARADDYAVGYLERQIPVSFHKFWENDPARDYDKYLRDKLKHEEL